MQIYEVTDTRFRKYGKVIRNIDFSALTEAMKKTPVPSDVVYEPSIAELEALPVAKEIEKVFYGELPIQIGYCNGHNVLLNAVEYHRKLRDQSCGNRGGLNIRFRGGCDR